MMSSAAVPARLFVMSEVCLLRDALASSLADTPGLTVVGTADSPARLADLLDTAPPDIVVLDAAMPGGIDLVRDLREPHPTLRFVAVAVTEQEQDVMAWAEAGVAGYVPRDGSVAELRRTLAHVLRGESVCSPKVAAHLFRRVASLSASKQTSGTPPSISLTQREEEIATLLDGGLSNKEIARSLCIEVATVKNHVHHILEKLQVRRRGEAAAQLRASRLWRSRPGSPRI